MICHVVVPSNGTGGADPEPPAPALSGVRNLLVTWQAPLFPVWSPEINFDVSLVEDLPQFAITGYVVQYWDGAGWSNIVDLGLNAASRTGDHYDYAASIGYDFRFLDPHTDVIFRVTTKSIDGDYSVPVEFHIFTPG